MKNILKKIIPKFILQFYHWNLAYLGSFFYGHPSKKMVVIGVTGTKGKSTVSNFIVKILDRAGFITGLISTINFKVGDKEWQNETKQTMPGRFRLQKLLSNMVKAKCKYVVVETSSEGIAQFRHIGIDYDIAVFTNLSPEHIESHGTFEKYRESKIKLFSSLSVGFKKNIQGKTIKKVIVVNHDDKSAEYFLLPKADKKISFGLKNIKQNILISQQVVPRDFFTSSSGISFSYLNNIFNLNLLGEFNIYNALAALAVTKELGVELKNIKSALEEIEVLPGRLEEIKNNRGIRIFVDYAHEPASLEAVYKTMKNLKLNKIISVLGSQGGGRDKAKRPLLGSLAAKYTDYVIVTNEDPYDEDPETIIDDVIEGANEIKNGPPIKKIVNRRKAIAKAISIARENDIIIITGKGSETIMAVAGGKMLPWDDRKVVKELI